MKIELRHAVRFSDVGTDFRMSLGALMRLFQDAAAAHSESIGFGIRMLAEQGISWMLAKLWLDIERYPEYGEELSITSWSRGASGFKMPRDFEIRAGSERVAAGSSLWFVVNTRDRKVERIPEAIDLGYCAEPELALTCGVETWSPYERFEPTSHWQTQTRHSDLDAGGHVNNAIYGEYLLAALTAQHGVATSIASLKLQFNREIGAEETEVMVGTAEVADRILFKILDRGMQLYARGECEYMRSKSG